MKPSSGRFRFLLLVLAVLLIGHPILVELGLDQFYRLVFAAGMVLISWVVSGSRKTALVVGLFAAPAIAAQVAAYSAPNNGTIIVAGSLTLLLLGYVIVLVAKQVFSGGRISVDRISGVICIYLLLGMIWSTFHIVLWGLAPGAYDVSQAGVELGTAETDFLYFSFVTLTTLGYGDIVPISPLARTLAWTEAVVGQLFLAITVARMVGLQVAHGHKSRPTA